MTSLDHRILIPSPPPAVWTYVSDLTNLPEWQVDCEHMTFLSQRREGIGTRWRQRAANRQEHVYEITSWYDTLGFEYILIDGAPYKTVQGRLRLQEIPEGTIVQWTFNYELGGGVLGGLRNALSTERRQDKLMVDSLKTLWKQSRRLGTLDNYVPRTLMRDGGPTNPEERAAYTSKRVTQTSEIISPVTSDASDDPFPVIKEPPISDEDTRPRPSVIAADKLPSAQPDDAAPYDDTPQITPDSRRKTDEIERFAPSQPPQPSEPSHDTHAPIQSAEPDVTPPADATTTPDTSSTPDKTEKPGVELESADSAVSQVPSDLDTGEVSIWEVFGIPSPTDTQRMRAIQAAAAAEAEYEAEQATTTPAPANRVQAGETASDDTETPTETTTASRAGVRSQLRRRTINIRRPG